MAEHTDRDTYLAALQRERAGYMARALPKRVAAVDAEIARLRKDAHQDGHDVDGGVAEARPPAQAAGRTATTRKGKTSR